MCRHRRRCVFYMLLCGELHLLSMADFIVHLIVFLLGIAL